MIRPCAVVLSLLGCSSLMAGENVWTTHGPPGSVTAMAVDPNGSWLLAGATLDTRSVGYRSEDHGRSWVAIGDAPPAAEISAFAVDPGSTMAYASVSYVPWGGRIYRSNDEGMTWLEAASLGNATTISSLAIRPSEPGTIYGGALSCYCIGYPCFYRYECSAAIVKSENSGATWSHLAFRLPGSTIRSLAFDPFDSDRIYAGGDGGAFASTDGGSQWRVINAGLEACPSVTALEVSPSQVLYAATARIVAGRLECGAVFRSGDGGRTWQLTSLPKHFVTSIAIDPTNPEIIYAGARTIESDPGSGGVFRSTDGGGTWHPFGVGFPESGVRGLIIEPSGKILHAATDAGVFDYEIVSGARPPVIRERDRVTRTLPTRP